MLVIQSILTRLTYRLVVTCYPILTDVIAIFVLNCKPIGGLPIDPVKVYAPGGASPKNHLKAYMPIGGFKKTFLSFTHLL